MKFRSDIYRDIYNAAVEQGWQPERGKRASHAYLKCPHKGCYYREAFSLSSRSVGVESRHKIADMRKHGFEWQGRKVGHTAVDCSSPPRIG